MDETGCYISLFAFLVIIIAIITALAMNAKAGEKNKVARGEQIAEYFDRIGTNSCDSSALRVLVALLSSEPIGFHERLVVPGGWFDRARPALTLLSDDPNSRTIVEWFFTCFTFLGGQQTAPLEWLQSLLAHASSKPAVLGVFQSVATRLLQNSSAPEAMWLYQRLLDSVTALGGDPRIKALALQIGRIAHAKSRRNGLVTIYDEQAIANDISARTPMSVPRH